MAVRAASARAGLQKLKDEMRPTGREPRASILQAESQMDRLMRESQDSINAGSVAAGRASLQLAQHEIETLEEFLVAKEQNPPPVRPAPGKSPELAQLRQDHNMLAIRASGARAGVQTLQTQMQRQGLGMRGDILEAEARMDYLMKESMDSIVAGDVAGGRSNLQMAERAVETIEKFLGR